MNKWMFVRVETIAEDLAMGPFGSDIKSSYFVNDGVPVIRGGNLLNNQFHDENFVFLTEEKADSLKRSNAYPGDIVFTHRGTLGQVAFIPENAKYPRYVVSQSQMKLTCNVDLVDPKYVYYYFLSPMGQHELLKNTATTGVPAISQPLSSLKKMEIPLPPLPVQKKIAAILSSLDDKIEINTRMNKVLEETARALFHRWFVEFEFPNDEGKPYKSSGGRMIASEMGEIPEGWRVGTVGEITTHIFSGGTPSTSRAEYWNGPYPWFSSGETRNHFVIDTDKSITELGIANSSTKLAKRDDIVIASAGQGFTRGQVSYLLLDTYINQSVLVLRSSPVFQMYLYLDLSRRYDELRCISDSTSIRGSLTTKMIGKFQLIIPPTEILVEFKDLFREIIILLENNLYSNKILAESRNALLFALMES